MSTEKPGADVGDVIIYNTRDENGNDIVKEVKIKTFPVEDANFTCRICGTECTRGIQTKKIVSSSFTDWGYVGDYTCEECAKLFSLYFYSYEVSPKGIELFNVREAREKILGEHTTPFRICITTSRKKHLFFKSVLNRDAERFAVNLEEETIFTSHKRMRELFDFVECMMTLGQSKLAMAEGEISLKTLEKVGYGAYVKLQKELMQSREVQIPLFCGQARQISEGDAIACITDLTHRM